LGMIPLCYWHGVFLQTHSWLIKYEWRIIYFQNFGIKRGRQGQLIRTACVSKRQNVKQQHFRSCIWPDRPECGVFCQETWQEHRLAYKRCTQLLKIGIRKYFRR
jgi:hypothetical protein